MHTTSKPTLSPLCFCKTCAETVSHMVGECQLYSDLRDDFSSKWPSELQDHMSLTPTQAECFTKLTLLGSCSHTSVCDSIYISDNLSLNFLLDLHSKRINASLEMMCPCHDDSSPDWRNSTKEEEEVAESRIPMIGHSLKL